jgi:hypothetical protein
MSFLLAQDVIFNIKKIKKGKKYLFFGCGMFIPLVLSKNNINYLFKTLNWEKIGKRGGTGLRIKGSRFKDWRVLNRIAPGFTQRAQRFFAKGAKERVRVGVLTG